MKSKLEKLGLYISTVGILSGAMVLAISALQTRRSVNALATISDDIHEKLDYLKKGIDENNRNIKILMVLHNEKTKEEEKRRLTLNLQNSLAKNKETLEDSDMLADDFI
jgi:hypothetical protein